MNLFFQLAAAGQETNNLTVGHHMNVKLANAMFGAYEENGVQHDYMMVLTFNKYNSEGNKVVGKIQQKFWHLDRDKDFGINNTFTTACDLADALYFNTDEEGEDVLLDLIEEYTSEDFDLEDMQTQDDVDEFEGAIAKALEKMIQEQNNFNFKLKVTANKNGFVNLSSEPQAILHMEDPRELPAVKQYELDNANKSQKSEPDAIATGAEPNSVLEGFEGLENVDFDNAEEEVTDDEIINDAADEEPSLIDDLDGVDIDMEDI